MQLRDLTQVIAIENEAQANPWTQRSFEESLSEQYCCRVIEMDCTAGDESTEPSKVVVAYHIVSDVVDELHVLNVVAAPQFQGLGLGHMLMSDIVELAKARNLSKLYLEVRASNEVAQSLYLKWQFTQIAIRKGYYRQTSSTEAREDAFVYMRAIS